MKFETISVVGLGYIGLPTAAVFASRKKKVLGVYVSVGAWALINQGEVHIVEPDLDMLVHAAVSAGYLRATTEPEPADAFLIAVPTPFKDGHVPDLSYIEAASKAVAKVLAPGNLVVLESTSPVGTTELMAGWMAEVRPDLRFPQAGGEGADIYIAHCPERVLPGHVLRELVHNDRVIGGMTPCCSEAATELYRTFVEGECIVTTARTAEMCKLTENSFRDLNIAFANELSIICDQQGIDVWELIRLANRHPRVNILQPGPGVGGHCIAVDPYFITAEFPMESQIIGKAREINNYKAFWCAEKVRHAIRDFAIQHGKAPSVALMGLAFKPNIDDLRQSPAVYIAQKVLQEAGDENYFIVEPNVHEHPYYKITDVNTAVEQADIVAFLVAHKEFKQLDIPAGKVVLDFCGVTK